ncbi:MAG: SMP-30/gluconolactonase/LRE family protein [Pirellulaceae bacterium]
MRPIFAPLLCLLAGCTLTDALTAAEPLVDASSPLETISSEFGLADGPAWDGFGGLYVPDVKGGKLYRYAPNQKNLRVVLDEAGRISASYFNHGRLYLSDNGNSAVARLDGARKVEIAKFDGEPAPRPNDLAVDNQGGVYVTLTREGRVAYITPKGEVTVAVEEIESPNGLALSPDEKTLYVAAYKPKQIWAYDITAAGKTSNARQLAAMDDGEALGADGMTVDRAGNVYCAGATDVWIWSPAGKLLEKIACPTRPINCAFGDGDMQSLYITGFGGLYRQRMLISGRSPQPPATTEAQPPGETRPSTALPADVALDADVEYARYGDRRLLMDLIGPVKKRDKSLPCLVVVHGGGWMKGDKSKFRALAIELAKRGYVAAAIEYRLGGEAKFPAAIHDCNAAVRYLRANAKQLGIDPDRIGAVGGSAGGHLVGLMATAHDDAALQGDGGNAGVSSKLQAAIVMAGPMEMTTGAVAERSPKDANFYSNLWLGKTIDEAPGLYRQADALLHLTKDDPPVLFLVGEHDKPERNAPFREKAKSLGVPSDVKVYADGKHGCWNQLPWINDMVADMDVFFREQLGGGKDGRGK